jgi:alpha-L-rhamnosidase
MKTKRKKTSQMHWTLLLILSFAVIANSNTVFSINVLSIKKTQRVVPANLTVNLRVKPIGIDSHPAFSWDSNVSSQTAYQIQVATSINDFNIKKFIWNTGKVKSPMDNQISYDGSVLKSATRYYWRVCVWDEKGKVSSWSEPSWWETGILNKADWGQAKWIGGRQPQDNNWTDMTATVNFRIIDASVGLTFLFHALPVGKVWSEAYSYEIKSSTDKANNKNVQLVVSTKHYSGNTGVPEPDAGENAIKWGVNYFDPQSEINPMAANTRTVDIATLSQLDLGEISSQNITTKDHQLKVKVEGNTITAWLDGNQVDQRILSGDKLRKNGSIGFGPAGGSKATNTPGAIIRNVKVEVPSNPVSPGSVNSFYTDFHGGLNPFEAGVARWTGASGNKEFDGLVVGVGKAAMLPIANPAPLIRKEFMVNASPIKSARLYISGGGYPKVKINNVVTTIDGNQPNESGSNVPHLTPDDGQSDEFILYNTFDVTKSIIPGQANVIAAELGRGWTGVTVPSEWYWNFIPAHGDPRTIAKLIITHQDGTVETVCSDDTWKTTDGATTFDSVYTGEKFDNRVAKTLKGWDKAGFNDSKWTSVKIMNPIGAYYGPNPVYHDLVPATGKLPEGFKESKLKAMENEPIVIRQLLKPIAIMETYPGSKVYLFKFEQMHTGWLRLHLKNIKREQAGLTLRMRGDNSITGSGTSVNPYSLSSSNIFIAADIQTDYYTLSDDEEQTWSPSFHYSGQGGIEVYGLYNLLGREPNIKNDGDLIVAEVASSGFPANSVTTSNPLLNRIHSLCEWTILNNAHGHPTDTPSREKNGWTGDGWADSEAWMLNFDVSQFYRLWVRDMANGMNSNGDLNVVMPGPRAYGFDNTPGWKMANGAVPAWDHAFFEVPWNLYQYYGDKAILSELYPAQTKFMNYYADSFKEENDYTFSNKLLGEYAPGTLGMGSTQNINHQLYFRMADYMSKVSELLGKKDVAQAYRTLANKVLKAFIKLYWNESTHSFQKGKSGNLETEQLLAVAFDMVPGNDLSTDDPKYDAQTSNTHAQNLESCMAVVANSIKSNGNRIGTGVYGLGYLFNLLDEYGYENLAYSIATGLENPSWGNILLQGGTTLQENWGGIDGNHHYHSSIITWYYQGLAGIKSSSPGYATLQIKPYIPTNSCTTNLKGDKAQITTVSAAINSPRGLIKSSWTNTDYFVLNVTIPSNTIAEVWMPSASGKVLHIPEAAKYLRSEGGYTIYSIRAGNHEFKAKKVK